MNTSRPRAAPERMTLADGTEWLLTLPPAVGWYRTRLLVQGSRVVDAVYMRWFDGTRWSRIIPKTTPPKDLEAATKILAARNFRIYWTDWWPENARVKDERKLK